MSDKKTFFGNLLAGAGNALTSGVFGLASNLLSNRGAKRRQQLADQQNVKFWNMQNEYNTPANQMKRLQDAGLNPNLIYGSGSANTGVAGSVAPSKPAPYNIKNPVPLQAMLMNAQINNLNSVTRKNDATADNLEGKTEGLGYDNIVKQIVSEGYSKSRAQVVAGIADKYRLISQNLTIGEQALELKKMEKDLALNGFHKGNAIATLFEGVLGIKPSQLNDQIIVAGHELPMTKRQGVLALVGIIKASTYALDKSNKILNLLNALKQ
jgi:hypothetical protein